MTPDVRGGDDVIINPTKAQWDTTAGRWERYEMLCDATGIEDAT